MKPEIQPIKSIADLFSFELIIAAIAILIAAWLLIKLLDFISLLLAKRFSRYRMQITGLFPVLRLLIWITAIYLIIVDVFDPPQNSLLAMMASFGLAVGLAAQDVIRNVISGVLILFEKPFRVGDMVNIGDHYGEVQTIGLRSVRLHTFDDNIITVPNATVMSQSVSNANDGALDEMVVVTFMVPALLDVSEVKNIAIQSATSSPYVFLKKPVTVVVEDVFNRTFLTRFTVKAYVLDVRYERLFASDVLERIKKSLLDFDLLTAKNIESALISHTID